MNHPFVIQKEGSLEIEKLYGKSDVFLFPYARFAFLEVLKKLEIKSIYIPSFICRDMLAPINKLSIQYFFYNVNEKLKPILEEKECDAILMVNYFGFAQDIKPFEQYCKKYEALLIEDNAHGFLSYDQEGKLLGSRGDIGLLSIRKTIFLPNGGALLINNDSLKNKDYVSAKSKDTYEDDKYRSKLKLKKKIFHYYIGIAVLLLRRAIRSFKTGSSIPLADPLSEKEMPSNQFLTPIFKNNVLSLDIECESHRRRKAYLQVQNWAIKFNIEPIYQLDEKTVPYEFMFIDHGNYKAFENYLLKRGFFILPWPDLPDEVVDSCPEFYKNIKVVPFLW